MYKKSLNFCDGQLLASFLITKGVSFSFDAISDDNFEISVSDGLKAHGYSFEEKLNGYKSFTASDLDEAVHEVASKMGTEVNNKGTEMQICFLSLHGYTPNDVSELLKPI